VAIVDDDEDFLRQVIHCLERTPGFRCACACASAEEALSVIPERAPDVVLMGLHSSPMSGIVCTASLRKMAPSVPVMMLTAQEEPEAVFNALKAGARGYFLKSGDSAELLKAIADLYHGGAPMSSRIARRVVESFHPAKEIEHPQDKLTIREQEILKLMAEGHAAREVASKLALSYTTVRWHSRHIYDKLHVHTRTEAVLRHRG
jgi:DNA-binding NarL/FixJ family response regulator